jgi:hypothetical protein
MGHTRKVLTMTKADLLDALYRVDNDTELLVTVNGKVAILMLGQSALKQGAIAVQVLLHAYDEERTSDIFWD